MSTAAIRKSIRNYYETRRQFAFRSIDNESSISPAFLTLLNETACPHRWLVIEKHSMRAFGARVIIPDATLQDEYSITRSAIFHYLYALLHHPAYRARYAEALKKELPRIPFAPDFAAFARIGERLMDLHINYESTEPYPLRTVENPKAPYSLILDDRMRLSKDRRSIEYNNCLTFTGIPPEAFDYRLGHRSALEWIIDQYRVKRDAEGQITSDPNRPDDPEYILRLVGQVVTVSLETQRLVAALSTAFS